MNASPQQLKSAISSADNLEPLARPMLELLQAATGLESTYLTTIDLAAGHQQILFSRNTRSMCIPEGLTEPWGDTLCKRAMDEGRAYTDNVSTCWGDSVAARELGIMTYVSQPVRTADGAVFDALRRQSQQRAVDGVDDGYAGALRQSDRLAGGPRIGFIRLPPR